MAVTLGYWSIRGLAQPIRFVLEYTGTKYDEKLFTSGPAPDFDGSQWTSVKDSLGLEFPNLPYYIDSNLKFTESSAILRHLARKNDLYGSTEQDKCRIDMAAGILQDASSAITMLCYSPSFATEKVAYITDINTPLQKLSKLIGSNNYIAGSKITYVDFMLYEAVERFTALVPDCLGPHGSLQSFQKRISKLPAMKKYLASPAFKKFEAKYNYPTAEFGTGV